MNAGPQPSRDRSSDLGRAVVEAVANAEEVDPRELERPLYGVVDPDALDDLFVRASASDGRVVFRYHGYDVTVFGDGRVTLEKGEESGK